MPELYGTGRNSTLSTHRLICEECSAKRQIPIFNTYFVKAACCYCQKIKPVVMVDDEAYLLARLKTIILNRTVDLSTDFLEQVVRDADRQGLSQHPDLIELLGDIRRLLRQRSLP